MDIGLVTVYRVLTQFERLEITCRNFEFGKAVYELNDGQQDHVMVMIAMFKNSSTQKLKKVAHVARDRGFVVGDHLPCTVHVVFHPK